MELDCDPEHPCDGCWPNHGMFHVPGDQECKLLGFTYTAQVVETWDEEEIVDLLGGEPDLG